MTQHLRESHDGVERCAYLMAHVGEESRLEFVCLFSLLLCLDKRMFKFHLVVYALRQSAYLNDTVLRFIFRHYRIHLQIVPFVLGPWSSDSHSLVESDVFALSYGISEIIAHLAVVRMENIHKIRDTRGTVVDGQIVVLVPLSCGIAGIVDDVDSGIPQLREVGGQGYNLVQLVNFLRVVLLAGLVNVSHKICYELTLSVVELAVSCHHGYAHAIAVSLLVKRHLAIAVFKRGIHNILLPNAFLDRLGEQCALEDIEFPRLVKGLNTENIQCPLVGERNISINIIKAQSYGHVPQHLFEFVSLRGDIFTRALQPSPKHHKVGQVPQPHQVGLRP